MCTPLVVMLLSISPVTHSESVVFGAHCRYGADRVGVVISMPGTNCPVYGDPLL